MENQIEVRDYLLSKRDDEITNLVENLKCNSDYCNEKSKKIFDKVLSINNEIKLLEDSIVFNTFVKNMRNNYDEIVVDLK